jgi:hypothetical protein
MKRNSSNGGRLKGVYLRGKKFWYRYNHEAHQYRVPLDTEDEGTALTKALKIRENPLLAGADPLKEEIDNYLAAKKEEGIYTRNSADTRSSVLHMLASDWRLKEVRAIRGRISEHSASAHFVVFNARPSPYTLPGADPPPDPFPSGPLPRTA